MRRLLSVFLSALSLLTLALGLALPPLLAGEGAGSKPAADKGTDKRTWAAEGVFADACQCSVFCPCEFNERPTFGHCDDAAILNLEKGHFGDVKLDGLRVVVVSQSPHGERLVDSVGRLTFAHIYVSDESTDAQMKALAEIARRTFGVFEKGVSRISEKELVERKPMQVKIEPYRYSARIPGLLDLDIEALIGGDGKTPIVMANHPFNPLGLGDPMVAHSKTYLYTRAPIDWNYGGRSASIRRFKVGGDITPTPPPPDTGSLIPPPRGIPGRVEAASSQ